MAGKIIANLVILGSGVLLRAVTQAYRQAIINGMKSGVGQEVANNVRKATLSKTMSIQEARMILGVDDKTSWDEISQKFENLYERNEKMGSFYIQSKVLRAKEALEEVHVPDEQHHQEDQHPS
ncbi:hypothetical protein CBR_g6531 [Chara braunii]|uniref:Uncharacterized protein n=1 Tax=Chara braunii TaxID=69332 RepID=A0A388KKB0_CHABU|nr:hypothetical protein CBR_g6531 [Chara braunii]|eukprot:GBG70403.1 hypothetical protein CBR_g6531 [Chara braunii]